MIERSASGMVKSSRPSSFGSRLVVAGVALVATLGQLQGGAHAQVTAQTQPGNENTSQDKAKMEQELLDLSKTKWQWMSERNVDALDKLLHPEAVFVHMGATMSKAQELEVIRSGGIQYKEAEIQEASVRAINTTAIVLNKIRLLAVVGGNEVTNPYVVTEVYVQQDAKWELASLSFTRLLGQ